ncbi:MAG: DUF4157 domain-containing protein, partial [Candidatus Acidiferrum sp.]
METLAHKPVTPAVTIQPAASRCVQCKAVDTRAPVGLQASLQVSSPKDPAEKEADATAKQVMRRNVPDGAHSFRGSGGNGFESPYVRRFAASGIFAQKREQDQRVLRKAEGQSDAPSSVTAGIQSSGATGSPLPAGVRQFMEPRFGADFSNVRIHTGESAANLNRQVNAHAFAVNNNVFFGKDKFQPETHDGKEL